MIIVVDQGVGDMFLSSDRRARPRQWAAKFSGRIRAPKMGGKFDQIGAMPDMTVAYLRFCCLDQGAPCSWTQAMGCHEICAAR